MSFFRDSPFLDMNWTLCALVVNTSSKELNVLSYNGMARQIQTAGPFRGCSTCARCRIEFQTGGVYQTEK